jgi:hypothetical protein
VNKHMGVLDTPLFFLYNTVTLLYKSHDCDNERTRSNEHVGKGARDGVPGVQPQRTSDPYADNRNVQWSLGNDGYRKWLAFLRDYW